MVNEPAVLIANLMALMVVYAYARKQGGMLKFFPVWVFMIPSLLGISLQAVFYGVSTPGLLLPLW